MAAVPRTLESPEIATVNANGGLTGDQRRVLGRDLYRERGNQLAASLGWIVISLVMLRILLPVAGSLVPMLFTDNHRGSRPVRFASATVTLPLWAMLKWFLVLLALAYVVAFCVQVKRLVAFLRLRHELLHGPVASVVGEVQQRDGQSLAIFASRQVRPWDAGVMEGVAPGMYRLFLLPRFDWLLSAQRLRDWERPTADEEALVARYSLAVINGFDPAALPDNRAGRLTATQARWLRDSAPDIGWRIFILFGFAIAVGVGGAVAYGGTAMQRGVTRDRLEGIGAGIVWAAIWTYLLAKQFVDNAKQKRDADTGQVRVYEGIVNKWKGGNITTPTARTHGSIATSAVSGRSRSRLRRSGHSRTASLIGPITRPRASSSSTSNSFRQLRTYRGRPLIPSGIHEPCHGTASSRPALPTHPPDATAGSWRARRHRRWRSSGGGRRRRGRASR